MKMSCSFSVRILCFSSQPLQVKVRNADTSVSREITLTQTGVRVKKMSYKKLLSNVFVASVNGNALSSEVQKLIKPAKVLNVELNSEIGSLSQADKVLIEENAEVLLADGGIIKDVVYSAHKLKWAACTWAGVDGFIKGLDADKPPACQITRMGGTFGPMMAEYVLMYILAKERSLISMWQEQKKSFWNSTDYRDYRSLNELTIGILGVGDIGREVAAKCQCMGMKVIGVTRSLPSEENRCPTVTEYRCLSELPDVLKSCDYICNILPSTQETRDLLSGDVLSNCKHKKSVFINIGRGDIISEESLVSALRENWLGGAILDVFTTEPLPSESPLWNLPGVYITPHVSGVSLSKQVAESFAKNYQLYCDNKPLKYVLDIKRGY